MILQIIQILLISLGFTGNNNNPKSLYRQQPQEYKPLKINPIVFLLLFTLGIIIFALLVFLFVPPMESGLVYNNAQNII